MYLAPKSKIDSRVHYAPEPARTGVDTSHLWRRAPLKHRSYLRWLMELATVNTFRYNHTRNQGRRTFYAPSAQTFTARAHHAHRACMFAHDWLTLPVTKWRQSSPTCRGFPSQGNFRVSEETAWERRLRKLHFFLSVRMVRCTCVLFVTIALSVSHVERWTLSDNKVGHKWSKWSKSFDTRPHRPIIFISWRQCAPSLKHGCLSLHEFCPNGILVGLHCTAGCITGCKPVGQRFGYSYNKYINEVE